VCYVVTSFCERTEWLWILYMADSFYLKLTSVQLSIPNADHVSFEAFTAVNCDFSPKC
jgi:hypothetical protein